MITDIRRATELHICERLMTALPGMKFVPFSGGDRGHDSFDIEPPFGVVAITEAEKTCPTESTWQVSGSCQWVTHITEATSPEHSAQFQQIYKTLGALTPRSTDPLFSFHGIDVDHAEMTEDDKSRARAGVIRFAAGVGG